MELVNALKELVIKGNKCDNGFRTGYLMLLENMLANKFPGTNLKGGPHINSKIHVWKNSMHDLTVPHNELMLCQKFGKHTLSLKKKTFSFYSDWWEIFGNDRATRNDSQHYSDTVNEMNTQTTKNVGVHVLETKQTNFRFSSLTLLVHCVTRTIRSLYKLPILWAILHNEFEACKMRGLVYDQLGSFEFLSVDARVEVSQCLCNNSKDMDLFFSLPEVAKMVLVKRIMKKLDFTK
ncbi:hypothetical protein ACS0TY_006808 [Phlomoides rotata]